MNIVPVNFSTKHRAMLGNVRKWIDKGHVAIDPDLFPELLTEWQTVMHIDTNKFSQFITCSNLQLYFLLSLLIILNAIFKTIKLQTISVKN